MSPIDALASPIEAALVAKLRQLAQSFADKSVRRLDIGVFPWHGSIEVSLLLTDDLGSPDEIAAWPHYNVSGLMDGRWPEAEGVCREMQRCWEADPACSESLFRLVGGLVTTLPIMNLLAGFSRSPDFQVTLLDPDNPSSPNYCDAT